MAKLTLSKTKAERLLRDCEVTSTKFYKIPCQITNYQTWLATAEALAIQMAGGKRVEHCILATQINDGIRPLIIQRNILLGKLFFAHITDNATAYDNMLQQCKTSNVAGWDNKQTEVMMTLNKFDGLLTIRFSALPVTENGTRWLNPVDL
jgi:hypothetical protein